VLVRLIDISRGAPERENFFPILGQLLGKISRDQIPVVEGMEISPTDDQFKALCAAAAASGMVGLFHMVGITPEAPTKEAAFQGRKPQTEVMITLKDIRAASRELSTTEGGSLNMVVIGCPHFSLDEFRHLVELLENKTRHPDVQFLVTTSRAMKAQATQEGFAQTLDAFGGRITLDTCILATPMLPPEIKVLMTNSAKCAFYTPGLLNKKVVFGSLQDCVHSAVEGRVVREDW